MKQDPSSCCQESPGKPSPSRAFPLSNLAGTCSATVVEHLSSCSCRISEMIQLISFTPSLMPHSLLTSSRSFSTWQHSSKTCTTAHLLRAASQVHQPQREAPSTLLQLKAGRAMSSSFAGRISPMAAGDCNLGVPRTCLLL